MSLTAAVRAPDSKIFHGMKGNKTSKEGEMLVQQQFCTNSEYFHLPTPSSSIDLSDNHHSKSSSSDSNSSRDEISDIPADIKLRSKEIPVLTCFNFDATNQDEISFKRGSKVYVNKNQYQDDQYVYIEFDNGKGGYAPKQFLQPVGNTPPIVGYEDIRRIRKIGEGSFSNVYKVEFKGLTYALKEFRESCFEKAKREAECLNVMDHRNIVKVYALCESPVSILMEFCEGDQLVNIIRRPGFNPPVRILMNWASQIAEGLWHMHNQEIPICHGDIKPSNVMIKERPCICNSSNYILEDSDICSSCRLQRLSRLTLKLTDFGLARPTSSNARNSLVGSAPYMAPEYIREMKMTPAADVWSFGVLVWELLTKEAPYHDANPTEKAAIMRAIGNGLKLDIPLNCSREQRQLLEKCWDDDDTRRPTMGQVIGMIKAMPKTDPDYVGVYKPNQPSTKSLIEFLKAKFLSGDLPEQTKPNPPKRKGKHVSKDEIGTPSNFRTVLSVQHEDNDRFTIHDHEVDRQRHLSSHDNCEQATLPRSHKSSALGNAYRSTPDLNVVEEVKESKLERTNAVRRKHGSRGGDQSIVASCLPTLDDNTSTAAMSPISASTPTVSSFSTTSVVETVEPDSCFVSNTIEVVDDIDKISIPIRNKISQGSLKDRRYSPKRSPSSNSNSTFYVSANGDVVTTPTYDTSTIKSESSIESSTSKKKGFLKNIGKHFKSKSQDQGNHDVCYDSETGKYYKLISPRPTTEDFSVYDISPAVQIATIPISQLFTSDGAPRFKKLQDSALSQRKKAMGHRRNQSNGSEKIVVTNRVSPRTPPPTPPSFHQSFSEGGLTPSTPTYLSVSNQTGSISPGSKFSLDTILPHPSADFRSRAVSSSDLRSRAATTDLPREPEEMAPFMHARSKSTDTRAIHEVNDNPFAKRLMQQKFVQNEGYFNVMKKPAEKEEKTAEKPHYRQLKHHPPLPPTSEPPTRPPRSSFSSNTVIELPPTRRTPPPVPPRTHTPSTSSNYVIPMPSRTAPSGVSPTPPSTPSSEFALPKSTAPVLRPDTLTLDNPRNGIRREHPYVHLSSNFKPDDNLTTTKVPHIPRNIKRH